MKRDAVEFMKVRDVATALGISSASAYRLIAEGKIPGARVGGVIRIPCEAWERWMAAQVDNALAGCDGVELRSR